ncbi:hypothetical protein A5789_04100 [Nocardia sp. 852002-51101_SCH5132738]|nr:hypothetical protein A5789_04100 [Nocardia sp. 852002-51101_SCH5132738]OBF72717.1 hypothetical protein A9X06_27915 [Mycobacterium sp. 852002-51759_SCH5129042]
MQCHPTWVFRDGLHDNVSPRSLGLSHDLVHALDGWAAHWDAIYDLVDDPADPTFDSPTDEVQFWEMGRCLAGRLRSELGAGWEVRLDFEGQ